FAVAIIALAAVLLFDEQFRDDGKPQPGGAFARGRVAGDRAHRAERGFDALGMRLRRVSGQPAGLRTPQTRAVRLALTPMILGDDSALIFHLKSLRTRSKTDTPSR